MEDAGWLAALTGKKRADFQGWVRGARPKSSSLKANSTQAARLANRDVCSANIAARTLTTHALPMIGRRGSR